ncbi:MAG TPA: hypothetical protein VMT94_08280 [Burkholderiales bacterium]|nr:hypothetical protein [Burkholderiales bacterium]
MKSLPLLWALVLGAVGFACGYFGPIIFSPDANQGPLLGIFVTGPGGLIAGFVLGLLVSFLPVNRHLRYAILGVACAALAIATLYFSMPVPAYQGRIIDAEIGDCMRPADMVDKAIERWKVEVARVTWSPPRADWEQAAERLAQTDPGVVLQMHVFRERPVYENLKPWNKGTLEARPWQLENEMRLYYARGAGAECANYLQPGRRLYFPVSEQEAVYSWPPAALPNFLDMQVLAPVPGRYQALAD